jgi:glycosyltransferase involved in cell wall biosynthesis
LIPLDKEAVPQAAPPITTEPAPTAEQAPAIHPAAAPEPALGARAHTITFLVYSPYPRYSGGRETWLHNVGDALSRRGETVTVVSHASNRRVFHAPVSGVEHVTLPSVRYFDRAFFWVNRIGLGLPRILETFVLYPVTAAWYLSRQKPKLLVCMNSIPEGFAAALARRPYFVSVRGDVPAEMSHGFKLYGRLVGALERWVLRRALGVLANGPDTQARLRRDGIASIVVPNGVDLARFRSPKASSAKSEAIAETAAGRPVISVVGTLRSIKGTEHAIETAVELKRSGVPFLMAMVGKGDEERYRRLAHARGVEDVVWFSGETRDVPAILRQTDIFLGLSGGSGLSMALLEAMAAGVAVVALDTPVYAQVITSGVNGLLASSAADLARACLTLLKDAGERRKLGAAAARTADHYDWRLVADRLLSVLAGG